MLFANYIVVKIYTDVVPDDYYSPELRAGFQGTVTRQDQDAKEANFPFQQKIFKDVRLPLYVILEPQLDERIDVVGIYPEGKINNETAFAAFLRHHSK